MRRGDATRGPGSTSTHLNFGPSQGQCGRTIRSPSSSSSPSPPPISFLLIRASNSLFLSFSRPFDLPLNEDRAALSRHTVLGSTPSPVPLSSSFFLLFLHGPTYDPAKSQLVEIPRDRTSANSVASYRRTRDNSHGRLNHGKYDRSTQRSQKFWVPARNVVAVLSLRNLWFVVQPRRSTNCHVRGILSPICYIAYVYILPARKLHLLLLNTAVSVH